jgi:ABC-type phosphonate transport system ATPase subunit
MGPHLLPRGERKNPSQKCKEYRQNAAHKEKIKIYEKARQERRMLKRLENAAATAKNPRDKLKVVIKWKKKSPASSTGHNLY